MSEAGHKFLAKLGKKRLRPGGKRATDWLIAEGYLWCWILSWSARKRMM